ncbi:MAG: winged helix DNA-binding domain-containing protein [Oscillospiraceae bacterium]|nr:winged helix DNA-binding domain-containing protein [Oscillospiraceae bacterium]
MDIIAEQIERRRMHGLYLSRKCENITQLSRNLIGLHCWFHRNVAFSAVIRGADLINWKHALTKTWLYRGTLHGVAYDDLPLLLAPHAGDHSYEEGMLRNFLSEAQIEEAVDRIINLMEDGVYSRSEMRKIFAYEYNYDIRVIDYLFSSWGGIFVSLACRGKVAFRDMASRDFDLIDVLPLQMNNSVLLELLRRFFKAYGPATAADAAWFFGIDKRSVQRLPELEEFSRLEYQNSVYYYVDDGEAIGDIPELTLLSGFDPLIVSYKDRDAVLPSEFKRAVILKSGICLPTIAVNGQVAGIWNIKNGISSVDFFSSQPERIRKAAFELVDEMQWRTAGKI